MKTPKPQSKADKAQSLLLMQAIQQTNSLHSSNGAIASKDGKRYLRSK
jgi:hypothetical protein